MPNYFSNTRRFFSGFPPNLPTDPRGPSGRRLLVSENGRFLVREDGTPFYWLGDTVWELFHRATRENAEYYLAKRSAQRFTLIQAVVLAEFNGIREPNAYGDLPLVDENPAEPNEAYFHHVDWIVVRANQLGLTVGMLPIWGDKVGQTNGDGPRIFTPQNARIYGEFLGKRYRDADVVWIIGGDRVVDDPEKYDIWRSLGEGLRVGDGGQHLMTFHPRGGDDVISSSSTVFANSDPLLDFNMRQNGHFHGTPTWARIAHDYSQIPAKPVIDGEPIYEDHPIGFKAAEYGYSNAHDCRRFLYWDLFAGAFGHTYGHHTVWQMHTPSRGKGINQPIDYWLDALESPGAWQIRHARALLESRPFLTRIPDDSLIVPSSVPNAVPGAGTKFMNSTRNSDGCYGMIYSASSRPYVVNPGQLSGSLLHYWWFNPRDGTHIDLGVFSRSNLIDVTPPLRGEDVDWVLVIDDAARGFQPPGFGQPLSVSDRGQLRFA
jgi:Protein of unknown function (DUF4038)/Putative collagen-binding domain of a collagenase